LQLNVYFSLQVEMGGLHYTEGELGAIEKGAYADILIVDGNPLEDLSVIGTQAK